MMQNACNSLSVTMTVRGPPAPPVASPAATEASMAPTSCGCAPALPSGGVEDPAALPTRRRGPYDRARAHNPRPTPLHAPTRHHLMVRKGETSTDTTTPPVVWDVVRNRWSSIGYGFVCHELQLYVAELWTPSYMEAGVHINVSETLAAAACLRIAGTLCPSARVHLRLDSTTAIAVVNKLTSRNSDLVHLARGIAHTCVRFDLAAHASHIPGCENVIADAASRGMPVPVPPSYSQYRVAEPDLMNWFSLHKRWQAKRLLQEAARQENATWPTGRGSRRTMDCQ